MWQILFHGLSFDFVMLHRNLSCFKGDLFLAWYEVACGKLRVEVEDILGRDMEAEIAYFGPEMA